MEPRRTRRTLTDLSALLADLARASGEDRLRLATVSAALAAALGPYLARRVSAVRVEDATVFLEMSDAPAAREVERHRRTILEDLRRRAGTLAPRALKVTRVAPGSQAAARRPRPSGAPPVPSPPMPLASAALEDVQDAEARRRLARLARLRAPDQAPDPAR